MFYVVSSRQVIVSDKQTRQSRQTIWNLISNSINFANTWISGSKNRLDSFPTEIFQFGDEVVAEIDCVQKWHIFQIFDFRDAVIVKVETLHFLLVVQTFYLAYTIVFQP